VSEIQSLIQKKGDEILSRMEGQSKGSIFSKDFWYGRIMEWSMKNENFKTKMFRFVDVLPTLTNNNEVADHLKEYFTENGEELPSVFNVGLGLGKLAPSFLAGAIRKNVTEMAKMFITGENPEEALPVLLKGRKSKICFTVDILGEATLGEKEALQYQSKYIELIEWLAKESQKWDNIALIDEDNEGVIPKVNVSVKLSALYSQVNDKAWEQTKNTVKERIRPLMQLAQSKKVFLNLDMEQYSVKQLTIEVFKELISEPEFASYPYWGCVIQAYLRDSHQDIVDLIQFAKTRKIPFTVRLVKGAYWDYESIEAEQRGWPIPVYTQKPESDANYEAISILLLENYKHIRPAFASHNVRTISAAMVHADKMGVPKQAYEIQMLYGMAEPIKKSLVEMGYRVREYAPVGDLMPGMAYLVRRLLENTSNESWLRSKFAEGQNSETLLKDPTVGLIPSSDMPPRKHAFENEPLLDFAFLHNRNQLLKALDDNKKNWGKTHMPWIDGKEVPTEKTLPSLNPSHPDQVVGFIGLATQQQAEAAIQSAHKAFKFWSNTSAEIRAQHLEKLAALMRRDRFQLIAEQIQECGKPWSEADGDVIEAIDFCCYYAQAIRELSKFTRVGHAPGEVSHYHYQARGVCVVIAPWNFPLAILAGQVASAMVTGNTVVFKPAEQSSVVAAGLCRLIKELQLPPGVVNFLPGIGEEVGEYIVNHPLTTTIAFTGSKNVGLHILKQAAIVHKGQKHVKRCIIEMGGKNAVIIDNDADLDEAVDGVVYSAFGFAGQKCSACSRVIVLAEVYDKFKSRLLDATQSIKVRFAEDPEAYLGPVIDEEAHKRILNTIAKAKENHNLLYQSATPSEGYFIGPTIFETSDANSALAQDEIFGPVLILIKAQTLEEAVQIANDTEYGLTGGVFSRSPAHIQYVKENLEVGNLYINRGITGAMVDRHPFGGFKMSGIGSKTGGPDYLRQFMEPRAITENTLRRGFAPTEQ
jgi:RHH-type proline utilization regulon transcriptional repressor/proline dehydrogenase/delta 1-pyrroline-5-carboxylate dehydrogenase